MTAFGPDHGSEPVRVTDPLRATPPAGAMAWVSQLLGGAEVEHCEVLRGGSSSAMHVVTVRHQDDRMERVVLRRYVLPADVVEPGFVEREAAALRIAEAIDVPTPTLLGSDLTGEQVGAPALLMTELDGRPVWEPRNRRRWCQALAEVLVAVHGVALPPPGVVPGYAPHRQRSYAVPRWARDPAMWERAIEIAHEPSIEAPARFVHRDFHPGNVLWVRGQLTGVVDWQHASVGPAVVDVGHNRLNFFFYDATLAQLFTTTWEEVAEADFDPWADIVAIVGALDNLRTIPPAQRARDAIERALAAAVAST